MPALAARIRRDPAGGRPRICAAWAAASPSRTGRSRNTHPHGFGARGAGHGLGDQQATVWRQHPRDLAQDPQHHLVVVVVQHADQRTRSAPPGSGSRRKSPPMPDGAAARPSAAKTRVGPLHDRGRSNSRSCSRGQPGSSRGEERTVAAADVEQHAMPAERVGVEISRPPGPATAPSARVYSSTRSAGNAPAPHRRRTPSSAPGRPSHAAHAQQCHRVGEVAIEHVVMAHHRDRAGLPSSAAPSSPSPAPSLARGSTRRSAAAARSRQATASGRRPSSSASCSTLAGRPAAAAAGRAARRPAAPGNRRSRRRGRRTRARCAARSAGSAKRHCPALEPRAREAGFAPGEQARAIRRWHAPPSSGRTGVVVDMRGPASGGAARQLSGSSRRASFEHQRAQRRPPGHGGIASTGATDQAVEILDRAGGARAAATMLGDPGAASRPQDLAEFLAGSPIASRISSATWWPRPGARRACARAARRRPPRSRRNWSRRTTAHRSWPLIGSTSDRRLALPALPGDDPGSAPARDRSAIAGAETLRERGATAREVLEREHDQRVTHQHRDALVERPVHRRPAATRGGVVETWQVVVDQRAQCSNSIEAAAASASGDSGAPQAAAQPGTGADARARRQGTRRSGSRRRGAAGIRALHREATAAARPARCAAWCPRGLPASACQVLLSLSDVLEYRHRPRARQRRGTRGPGPGGRRFVADADRHDLHRAAHSVLRGPDDAAIAPGGYAWWYVDALSADRRHGLTVIALLGSVFSPYYARARRRDPAADPLQYCAMNVALYGDTRIAGQ